MIIYSKNKTIQLIKQMTTFRIPFIAIWTKATHLQVKKDAFFLFLKKNQQNTILVQSWLKSNCFRFLHSAWSTHNDFRVCQNVLITMHTYFMVIVLMDIYIYDSNFPKMSESRKRKYSCYQNRKKILTLMLT